VVDLKPYAGQTVKFRFRFGSDESVGEVGWYVDDIQLKDMARVNMRSWLFNGITKLLSSDTSTIILPCVTGTITSQPVSSMICRGSSTSFSVSATGTSLTYQWQRSNNGGTSYTDIAGATQPQLNLSAVPYSDNGTMIRCVINGACTSSLLSNTATLTVYELPQSPQPNNNSRCGSGDITISASAGFGEVIDWYVLANGGNSILSSSNQLLISNLLQTTTYYAQSVNHNTGCTSLLRSPVTATIKASTNSNNNIVSCGGYSWNGNIYSYSGTYSYTTTNAVGCDSVATLHLIVNNTSQSYQTVFNCGSYQWNGTTYTTSGQYSYTTTNTAGCDSLAVLSLTVGYPNNSQNSVSACDSYLWNGMSYTSSGTYSYIGTNASGCD
jgi:hypothetical protein